MSTATPTREHDTERPHEDDGGSPARLRRILKYGVLGVLTLLFVSPLLYMLSTAFKTTGDAASPDPQWIPDNPTTGAFEAILGNDGTPVVRWLVNSLVAAGLQSLLIVATAALAGYALARMDFAGKKWVFGIIIGTLFIPPVILLIPNYLITSRIGWLDTLAAVIVPGAAGAFGVFFMRQFFLGIPPELEEAASMDGAGRFRTFVTVVLPLSRPALVTLGMLSFLTNWNDFLWPVYVLFSPESQTLPAGLATLQNANAVRYDLLMAGAVIASAPVLVLYAAAQRFVVEGVSRAGLKG
ncbi:carbohydrate ABC transporter permease [Nocardioides pinisoli]|uniref:Carbohydrate ABC transporter permease n=1 Tax=Nocardioides pinisoli TaxID=2950279 RepID=A0ABT1KZ04_9ACTN|nr:carbohydrate ABC transporter permease [Nocardioides pinisoli]MCP3423001.1 carbohydrate ABC transporter permease [Nocardioides pinisoli]